MPNKPLNPIARDNGRFGLMTALGVPQMRTFAPLLVLALAGCQTTSDQIPTPPPGCYARIPQRGEVADLNVTPEKSLTDYLVQLVPEGDRDVQHCWSSTPEKNLKLVAGDACQPHSEYEFQWNAGAWVLANSRREEFVQCHYRR